MIEIVEGHNSSSYFWIMPVKYKYNKNKEDYWNNVEELRELEISIEEDIIDTYFIVDFDCWKESDIIKYNVVKDRKFIIVDFYNRFIGYIENMMIEGKNKGYDLISVMGP